MISRKSTVKLELLYEHIFTTKTEPGYLEHFDMQALWEYLYEEEIEGWFMTVLKAAERAPHFKTLVFMLNTSFDKNPESGQQVLMQMANAVLKFHGPNIDSPRHVNDDGVILTKAFLRQLEIDGFVYRNEKLYSIERAVIPEQEEQNYLEQLIKELKLVDVDTIKHHLRLSEDHFVNGRWDDSISNSRKVLDAILNQLTQAVYLKVEGKPAPQGLLTNARQTREYLEKQGLITTPEREAFDKTYGVLSVTGGHPYIAEKDQARLLRHLALTFSQFVLLRYQGFLNNNP
jgi:hypothetical protein